MKTKLGRRLEKLTVLALLMIFLAGAVISFSQSTTSNSNVNGNANATTRDSNRTANSNANANSNGANGTASPTHSSTPKGCDLAANNVASLDPECRKVALVDNNLFVGLVAIVFLVVLVPFVYIIIRSIKYSSATYRNPLGLPDGSIRAIIAYILVAFVGLYVLASVLSMTEFKPPEFLMGIVATVIGFYFGSRPNSDKPTNPATSSSIKGKVTDNAGAPVSGATVTLSRTGKDVRTATTSTAGEYEMGDLPSGKHEIQATHSAHKPSEKIAVSLTTGQVDVVDFKMS